MNRWILRLSALFLLLSACGSPRTEDCVIYYRTAEEIAAGGALYGASCELPPDRSSISPALELLLSPPEDMTLQSPFPAGTKLNGWTLEEGRLTVDFSEQYGKLYGIDLTLADYCVALTLTQLEGVEEVSITVAGGEVPGRNRQVFRAGDVVLEGDEAQLLVLDVQLSFPLADGSGLGTEYREIRVGEGETPAGAVLQALRDGPTSPPMTGFLPAELGEVRTSIADGLCTVELDGSWQQALTREPERQVLAVYALVNSLTELASVDQVLILYEGGPVWGTGPLEPDYRLNLTP